jgi:putative flippase GtrA
MKTFIKAQASSLISSAVDFLVFFILKEFIHSKFGYIFAAVTGTISGGITNFLIGRFWAFKAKQEKPRGQAFKYAIVWIGNLILNALGIYLLKEVFKLNETVSKIITSLLVGFGYNYTLQKYYVFKKAKSA